MQQQHELQRKVTRICVQCACILQHYGAESILIENLAVRIGKALGMDNVEIGLLSNSIILTTIANNHCMTTVRSNHELEISMTIVTQIQQLVIRVEQEKLTLDQIYNQIIKLNEGTYPKKYLILMVAFSCGCFSLLNAGNWSSFVVAFTGAGCGIFIKNWLHTLRINQLIIFSITAFVCVTVSGWLSQIPFLQQTSTSALASSILLLVPGFPLINAVADMYKGHINNGVARWIKASLFTLSTCLGVVVAMYIWRFQGWI